MADKLVELHQKVIQKELILHSLQRCLDNKIFNEKYETFILDTRYEECDQIRSVLVDSKEGSENVDVKDFPNLEKIVEEEVGQMINWVVDLKRSFGPIHKTDRSTILSQCQTIEEKTKRMHAFLNWLLQKQDLSVNLKTNVSYQTIDKICDILADKKNVILQSASDLNKEITAKIYDSCSPEKFEALKRNLVEEINDVSCEIEKSTGILQLYEGLLGVKEYQNILDEYASTIKEIKMHDIIERNKVKIPC
ncbi:uncharacterized protein LOC106660870 [Cimex lectularius]|uniref:Uncharacterized protein n=1 Tax=Cimex lectularius TaxID=79782 RepID=A0A8I6R8X2_CIMLE|nr:uncharacterized protein LOC106660870 [Cimex lectularius]